MRSTSTELERLVGHPATLYENLLNRIQGHAVARFTEVADDWLRLMWSVDAFRGAGLIPRAMGNTSLADEERFSAVYRTKGNWFATVIAALLQQQTHQPIAAKNRIRGFSQPHQIDVAWPARDRDPLVCIETKVTGAPGTASKPARSAVADYTNRRKEIKFAATDLKLYRRQQDTAIEHWGVWRGDAPPKVYFLWGARLRTEGRPDRIETMRREAHVLIDTYLDGAGIFAWQTRATGGGYDAVPVPSGEQVTSLDDVIYRVASEIRRLAPRGVPPPPQLPSRETRGAAELEP